MIHDIVACDLWMSLYLINGTRRDGRGRKEMYDGGDRFLHVKNCANRNYRR